ncbi:MAG TPA: hypothetical protein EYG73_06560 [Arcobacter sp.]|nr:hypothetical protein [Arcobacter sp.]
MFERLKDTIFRNDYIGYLEHLGIDQTEIINNIKNQLDKKDIFDIFSNRSYEMLSPNTILENIIFEEVHRYLFKNEYPLDIFKRDIEIDIKTIISTQNSVIERPKIPKPSEMEEGFKTEIIELEGFIQIARFENETIEKDNGWGRQGQTIVFEGLSIFGEKKPFSEYLPSSLIWHNAFYYEPFIIGFIKKFNSIEANNVLWINSLLLNDLGLFLDDFNNGLQALNEENEVVLKFRQWRSDLIGNGASFVGQDSNIAKLEGCDLILREDYYEQLKVMIPEMKYYSKKLDMKK